MWLLATSQMRFISVSPVVELRLCNDIPLVFPQIECTPYFSTPIQLRRKSGLRALGLHHSKKNLETRPVRCETPGQRTPHRGHYQCASNQFLPQPASATRGTLSWQAPCISLMTICSTRSFSSGKTEKLSSSCT